MQIVVDFLLERIMLIWAIVFIVVPTALLVRFVINERKRKAEIIKRWRRIKKVAKKNQKTENKQSLLSKIKDIRNIKSE